ncbi:DUF3800 domain-containing protein [Adhaeribacter rhizoryzae]|uniref:DUF3800 domain-containing protein n=1 Tax=Adhaeribacter rhizoryzae TaxID=2607907 RepID=A0A5M6D0K3_9BACT|nr:DUF3800 domain-containing protein [Adhaeribacter rhizoryzae]KAA5539119.1 DUF3800 domain-containing protein [Adhaeribacter rhizoryzae]
MQHLHLFVAEFGNASLNQQPAGSFSHYVLTAVLIEEAKLMQARELQADISQRFFQGHPIQSSRIPDDELGFQMQVAILQELRQLDFLVLSLVINKSKVVGEGLSQQEIFYKYFNRIFLKQFPQNFTSFSIHADQVGWPGFQRSLQHYIQTKVIQRDLFTPDRTYQLVEDRLAEPLVQLADFIAGCLGKIYCTSHSHEKAAFLFDLLHDRSFVDFFPFEKTDFLLSIPEHDQEKNELIAQIAAASAREALAQHHRLSEEAQAVLQYLYLMFRTAPDRLVEKYEIIEKLKKVFPNFSEQQLRVCIQHLRDDGVLIVSIQGKSGYKIPDRVADIAGFYNRYLNSIVPMINRLNICNRKLLVNSLQQVDLLQANSNYSILHELIKTLDKDKQPHPPLDLMS